MRRNRLLILIVPFLTIGLTSFATAQMMGGNNSHSSMINSNDSTSQQTMMGGNYNHSTMMNSNDSTSQQTMMGGNYSHSTMMNSNDSTSQQTMMGGNYNHSTMMNSNDSTSQQTMMGGNYNHSTTMRAVDSLSRTGMMGGGMMNGNYNHMSMTTPADTTWSNGMMGGQPRNMAGIMDNIAEHYRIMTTDFDALQAHFDMMMKIKDMKTLKAEMYKQHNMMQKLRQNMVTQRYLYDNMVSLMQTHGMVGMVVPQSFQSTAVSQKSDNH